MKTILIDYHTKEIIGELNLICPPRTREWVEFENNIYYIYQVLHTNNSLKLIIMDQGNSI